MSEVTIPFQVKIINNYILVCSEELDISITVGNLSEGFDMRKLGSTVMQLVSKRLGAQQITKKKKKLRTVTQMAQLLNVSPMTVRRMTDQGHLKVFRTPGGHRRIWSEN